MALPRMSAAFFLVAFTLSLVFPLIAQEPEAIPVESESHHHVILANSYVRVLFVEIPPHEATLRHHHDLPYVSLPPTGPDAMPAPPNVSAPAFPPVTFAPAGATHAVNNPGDRPIRNIAVQLVRPQGSVRNRCSPVLRGQPFENCEPVNLDRVHFYTVPLLETDEILVEEWYVASNFASRPWKAHRDMLIGGISGVTISAGPQINSENTPHGILWLRAHSKMVFRTTGNAGGRFISITFKDDGPATH